MTKAPVSPERFEDFIKSLQLVRLRLVSLEAKANADFPDPERNALYLQGHASYEPSDGGFEAFQTYEVTIKDVETDTESGRISAVYGLTYSIEGETDPEELSDFFEIFSKTSLLLHVYPYVRQLVHDLSTRMGWPPVILPIATPQNDVENTAGRHQAAQGDDDASA